MPRFFFTAGTLLWLLLMPAILAAPHFGALQPINPVMQGLRTGCEGKDRPCWYGVTLGETTTREVEMIFGGFGDVIADNLTKHQLEIRNTGSGGCFAQFIYGQGQTRVIQEIILTQCERLQVGDLLAHFGTPLTLGTGLTCDKRRQVQHSYYYMDYPADGILASIHRPATIYPWLSLYGTVRQLYLVNPNTGDGRRTWEGFIGFWHFVQKHPEQITMTNCWP